MKFVVRLFLALLCLLLLLACGLGYYGYTFLQTPPEREGRDLYFDVVPGAHFAQVTADLKAKGLLTDALAFRILARCTNQDQKLQAGRFLLNTAWLPEKVLWTLVYGKPVLYRITLPEGLTLWQTARLLEEKGFVKAHAFEKVVQDPAFLLHCGIPFSSAEGFLMPETYLLRKPEELQKEDVAQEKQGEVSHEQEELLTARKVAQRLIDTFWQKTKPLWPEGKRPQKEQLRQYMVLASIVEKETALADERPRVAGVYTNRLKLGMLLQADPTVIYGLGPRFSGKLLYRHLDDAKNPYNTYQHQGLPPGPICSFGLSALRAAIIPEKHKFLYFVARTDGGEHVFSTTLGEHTKAVEQYRKQRSQRR